MANHRHVIPASDEAQLNPNGMTELTHGGGPPASDRAWLNPNHMTELARGGGELLFVAAKAGCASCLSRLIHTHNPRDLHRYLNQFRYHGHYKHCTALGLACQSLSMECIEMLLNHGAQAFPVRTRERRDKEMFLRYALVWLLRTEPNGSATSSALDGHIRCIISLLVRKSRPLNEPGRRLRMYFQLVAKRKWNLSAVELARTDFGNASGLHYSMNLRFLAAGCIEHDNYTMFRQALQALYPYCFTQQDEPLPNMPFADNFFSFLFEEGGSQLTLLGLAALKQSAASVEFVTLFLELGCNPAEVGRQRITEVVVVRLRITERQLDLPISLALEGQHIDKARLLLKAAASKPEWLMVYASSEVEHPLLAALRSLHGNTFAQSSWDAHRFLVELINSGMNLSQPRYEDGSLIDVIVIQYAQRILKPRVNISRLEPWGVPVACLCDILRRLFSAGVRLVSSWPSYHLGAVPQLCFSDELMAVIEMCDRQTRSSSLYRPYTALDCRNLRPFCFHALLCLLFRGVPYILSLRSITGITTEEQRLHVCIVWMYARTGIVSTPTRPCPVPSLQHATRMAVRSCLGRRLLAEPLPSQLRRGCSHRFTLMADPSSPIEQLPLPKAVKEYLRIPDVIALAFKGPMPLCNTC